jgi:hypothetical protein
VPGADGTGGGSSDFTTASTGLPYVTSEAFRIAINGHPTGGTFKITFGGQQTAAIPYNASGATVQAAMEALSTRSAGKVTVTNDDLPEYILYGEFRGTLAGTNQATPTATSVALTGGASPNVQISGYNDGTPAVLGSPIVQAYFDQNFSVWWFNTGTEAAPVWVSQDAVGHFWSGSPVMSAEFTADSGQAMSGTWRQDGSEAYRQEGGVGFLTPSYWHVLLRDYHENQVAVLNSDSTLWEMKLQSWSAGDLKTGEIGLDFDFNRLAYGSDFKVLATGAVITGQNAAPADSDLNAGEVAFWFDQTNGAPKVMVKGKTADGTAFTRTLADTTMAGGGAPTGATYLVATADPTLSAEIVVGATPGGELGGTWASPTVDATHSGSAHHNQAHSGTGADHTYAGLTTGHVLTAQSATTAAFAAPSGGGAPTTADYLVGTAQGGLSAEIVVGTTPGGELGGSWASPTIDASHSGSTHAATQAAAEATASGALTTHAAAADPHTGYRLESADHSHASTGLQGGQVAHTALSGVTADQHHTQAHVITGADHTMSGLTTGHVLTATSATAAAFAAPTGGTAIPDPGHAYGTGTAWWYIPGNMIFGSVTKAMNANFMNYYPWYLTNAWTFDTLAIEVTTLGAGLMRAGLYNADLKWQPTTLVQDFGTFDVSTAGVKTKSITALALPAGRYIACLVDNVNCTIRVANVQNMAAGAGTGLGANNVPYEWYRAFTYAALPADGTTIPWTTPTYGAGPYYLSGLYARNSTGG